MPLTASKTLFAVGARLGNHVIWLHSFGERMGEGHPGGPPRLPPGRAPKVTVAIPATPDGFPETIDYDAATRTLKVGAGRIAPVTPAMWSYQVSGKQVLRQWFSYRGKDRSRPIIGDRRPPSPAGYYILPDQWLPQYTEELLNVLNILGLVIDLVPRQRRLLKRVFDGPLVPAGKIGVGPVREPAKPRRALPASRHYHRSAALAWPDWWSEHIHLERQASSPFARGHGPRSIEPDGLASGRP